MNFKSKENTAGHQIMHFNIWGFNEIKHMKSLFFFRYEKYILLFLFFLPGGYWECQNTFSQDQTSFYVLLDCT